MYYYMESYRKNYQKAFHRGINIIFVGSVLMSTLSVMLEKLGWGGGSDHLGIETVASPDKTVHTSDMSACVLRFNFHCINGSCRKPLLRL